MILVIDTAVSQAFIGIWEEGWKVKETWEAGRSLSAQILEKLDEVYNKAGFRIDDTKKIIANAGPGSYTGLRIGLSVANTMAYARNIPIAGIDSPENVEDLLNKGLEKLKNDDSFNGSAIPNYGSEPNITQPKKPF
jgi:tRNA threonylcarbamoyladenosine biosynthesis protein TsaB